EEVEQALKEHPDVRDAVVIGVPHERFGEQVAAVFETGAPVSPAELRSFARSRLADYKVPRVLIDVEAVERGANGKADLRAIRARIENWMDREKGRSSAPAGGAI